jgi:membrane fusion protein, multidrug efflux system
MYPSQRSVDAGVEVDVSLQANAGMILLLTGASLAATSCSRVAAKTDAPGADDIPVRAVRAIAEDVPLDIAAVGNVESVDSVAVKARIGGQVERVAFQEGETVAKGQLLFTIDRAALDRQVAEQRADLARDAAMEEQAHAIVARDAASQRQSQSEADVAVKLGNLGVISGQRVDELTTALETASASLHSDEAAVGAAEATGKADQARLAETELQLSQTNIVAPIAGRVGAAAVKAGNIVADNSTTLVTLLQMMPIDVTFGVPEQTLSDVRRLNARGTLTVEASQGAGGSEQGQLLFIDNTVDATTGTIRLKAIFPNTDGALWPGEFVHVRLRLRVDPSRTVIPNASVEDGIDGKYVWLVRSGRTGMTSVTVMRTYLPEDGPELAVIGAGIRPGDLVVTEGQLRLTAGARVSLLNDGRGSGNSSTGKGVWNDRQGLCCGGPPVSAQPCN